MECFSKICLLIPAYNPDNRLISIVSELYKLKFCKIIIVNDGSNESCSLIFQDIIEKYPDVTLLGHRKNIGKGAALRTGLNFYLNQFALNSNQLGIVTLDADGQYLCKDIQTIARELCFNHDKYLLGVKHAVKKSIRKRCRSISF